MTATGKGKARPDGVNISSAPPGFKRPKNAPPGPPPVPEKSAEALRQEKHRLKMEALGVKSVEVQLGPIQRLMLETARKERGGLDGPYSVAEYLATLLRRDFDLLEQQLGQLAGRVCENCRKPLPRGCGGVWAVEAACLRAQADKALQL